jgi:hypothetical protein
MKIFLDLNHGLLLNNIKLEGFLYNIKKYFLNFWRENPTIINIPYNPKTLSVLKEYYTDKKYEIIILHKKEYVSLAAQACEIIHKITEKQEIYTIDIDEYDKYQAINDIAANDYIYITGCLHDWKLIKEAKEACFVGNCISYIVFFFLCKKDINSRTTLLGGLFSTFWNYLNILWPIVAIWPSWFYQHNNSGFISGILYASMGFMSCFELIHSLVHIQEEREHFLNNEEIFFGKDFIIGHASIEIALCICVFYLLLAFRGFYYSFSGGFIGLIFSFIVLSTLKYNKKFRSFVVLAFFIGVHLFFKFLI